MNVPTRTVTFLFTDIEGSTLLWEQYPESMRPALLRHDNLLRDTVQRHNGYVFKTMGDAFCAAFASAPDALNAALAAQQALHSEVWPEPVTIKVRMALHTGVAEVRDNDYFGQPLNRVARLLSVGYGGQTLLSLTTRELTHETLPSPARLLELGKHSLRDLVRQETVYQLLHPSLPADFPPLKSLNNPDLLNNLPLQLTSFIGREKQISEVKSLLKNSRLLTLTGGGGCGKTRLSLQVAADVLEQYPDGVWLIELAPLSDPALVLQAVASTLNLKEQVGKTLLQTLTETLKPKNLLLVLDNCEHLLGACALLADALLRSCGDVRLLASSREALGISGEQTYRVPSLSLPDLRQPATIETVGRYEAVQLCIERARLVKPDFEVTDRNASALVAVCRQLDGIPLAIELAAARVRSLSIEDISSKLDSRFRLLTGGSRTALPRQQTLRALIDWSYDLLNLQERALLNRLSVFAGGWTLPAAEAVCAGDGVEEWEVLDLLTSLVDKSLAIAEPQESDEQTRYRLLETVRQYARGRLEESGETRAARERHQTFFLAFAREAAKHLNGPEQGVWLERLETEHDNLRSALGFCLGEPEKADAGLQLGAALHRFWLVRGHSSEGRECLAALLARQDAQSPSTARADALGAAGVLARVLSDYAESRLLYEESLAIRKTLGDRRGIADSLGNLGNLADDEGDYATALSLYKECLAIQREMGDKPGLAATLNNMGLVAHYQGDYPTAQSLFEQALAANKELGHKFGIAVVLSNLGMVVDAQGDYDTGRSHYEESLALRRELGDKRGLAVCINNLSAVALTNGDYGPAHAWLIECLALCREIGEKKLAVFVLEGFAQLAQRLGQSERAVRLYGSVDGLQRLIGMPMPPSDQKEHDRSLAELEGHLARDVYESALAAGQAMNFDQAITYALEEQEG